MKRFLKLIVLLILCLIIGYFIGPRASFEQVNNLPLSLSLDIADVENYIKQKESKISNIKSNNQAQIIWADSTQKTEYAFVYLHGFTASHGEGYPIIQNLAEKYKSNTFLSRIHGHGLTNKDAFLDITPKSLLESAKEAIAIAKTIGHKVIVMSCSTGSTYAAYLEAQEPALVGQIMFAPNFDLNDTNSKLLVKPWGHQLAKYITGGDYRDWGGNDEIRKYWNTVDRLEGYIALRDLLNQTMTDDVFSQNKVPTFLGYYYKDDSNKDTVISIDAIQNYSQQIVTPKSQIKVIPFDNATGHVVCSSYMNPNWESVQDSIYKFIDASIILRNNQIGKEVMDPAH